MATAPESAEAAARLSAEFLRRAHTLAGIGTYVIDPRTRTIHMSAEMVHLLGAGTEALTLPLDEYRARFYHPAELAHAKPRADAAYVAERSLSMESRVVRADGKVVWLRSSSGPERAESGDPIVVGVVQDVTEQHDALEELAAQAQRLQESETRFRTLIESAPVAIGISRDGLGVYCNRKFLDLWGYASIDQVVGRPVVAHWAPESQERIAERVRLRAAGALDVENEDWTAQRADGSRFTAHLDVTVVDLPDGPATVAFCADVTERDETRRKLEERVALGTLLADLTARFLEVPDEEISQVIAYAQERMCALFGFQRSSVFEPVGADGERAALTHVFPAETDFAQRGAVVDEYFPWTVERLRKSRGTVVIPDTRELPPEAAVDRESFARIGNITSVSVPWISPRGEILAIMSLNAQRPRELSTDAIRQIETAAKVILVALGRAKERRAKAAGLERMRVLTEMLDEAPAGVLVIDLGGHALYANRFAAAMHGYTVEELSSLSLFDLLPPEDRAERRIGVREIFEKGAAALDSWHVRKDGTRFRAHVRVLKTQWAGQPALLSVQTDLTESDRLDEERRAAEGLRSARDAAEHASRAKSSFLAHISHEIRTPMNAILGYAQLLERDPALGDSQRGKIKVIHSSGAHLLHLLNDVLEMSKIEAGRISLTTAPFDLRAMLADVESMFHEMTRAKGVALILECAPDLARGLDGDGGKVKQVVINLLSNAVKFTESGRIRIRASSTPRDGDKHAVRIDVVDTGIGIEAEGLARLFQSFEQLAAGARIGGTGLGLAISRSFAQLMGGDLTVTSRPGEGSVFSFAFEARAGAIAATDRDHGRVPLRIGADQAPRKILVVDDVATNRALCGELLSRLGFEISEASTGGEAIATHEAWHPDLVLMDLRMPGMDGFATTKRLRALGSKARIVALTASGLSDAEPEALAAGADLFLRKPYEEADLLRRIGDLLGVRYEYAEEVVRRPSSTGGRPPLSLLLRGLPAALVGELRDAAVAARAGRIEELAKRVDEHSPSAADAIREAVGSFRYDLILSAVEARDGSS